MGTPAAPRVTLGLITYRQAAFVREAVGSALAQRYPSLEIVICDDASPDDTYDIAHAEARAYRGPHVVRVCRNARNLGIGNFNRLMEVATGELVVIAHGDDISSPNRVARIVEGWLSSGASMVTSNALLIDAEGRKLGITVPPGKQVANSFRDIAANGWNPMLLGAVLAWERQVFDVFGPLDPDRSALTSDFILPFRAAALKGIHYIDEPLVKVRQHEGQKQRRFINDPNDRLAGIESHRANHMMQKLYMLDTLDTVRSANLRSGVEIAEARELLVASMLNDAQSWRTARNRLYASGKRVRWLPPDN